MNELSKTSHSSAGLVIIGNVIVDFRPKYDEKHFLFTSLHKGNTDVWKLPLAGVMTDLKEWEENRADDFCIPEVPSYSCVLILNNLQALGHPPAFWKE